MPQNAANPLQLPSGGAGLSSYDQLSGAQRGSLDKLAEYANNPNMRTYTRADGSIRVENQNGQVAFTVGADTLEGIDPEFLQSTLSDLLGNGTNGIVGIRDDGSLYVDYSMNGPAGDAPPDVTPAPGSSGTVGGNPIGGGGGGAGGAGGGGGGPVAGGGGASLNQGGGAAGDTTLPDIDGGGSGSQDDSDGGLTLGAGGGDSGPPPIDPNASLGLDFGQSAGSLQPGDQRFNDPNVFSRPTPFTSGLGPDASLNDILLAAMGEQRATRDAALGISGGLASSFEGNPLRQQAEQNALDLGANPFSLDDRTVQRMLGQQGELIGRNAERLQQAQADRAAAQGISRSGLNQAQQDRIAIDANRQLGDAQRGLLVEQATRRPQDLANATKIVNDTLQQQQAGRERIAGGAINTLQNTDITGDAAVLGSLAGGGPTPQINVSRGPRSGAFGGVAYAGPAQFNPFR